MSIVFKHYKRIFRLNLQPVFVVLIDKRMTMEDKPWEVLVKKTINSIVRKPSEYLGEDLHEKSLVSDILEEIENDFFKDVQLRQRKPFTTG